MWSVGEEKMKARTLFLTAVVGLAVGLATPASADFVFTGSGSSGTFVGQASEPWELNADGGNPNNWGSPGVGNSTTPYLEGVAAFGLDLTFFGVGPIDPASIIIGNGANCIGASSGGTTFCNEPFGAEGIWNAFLTGPNSIAFRAQNVGQILDPGELFFVNVFFTDSTPPTNFSFNGVWITEFSPTPNVPVPAALPLFATGLAAIGLLARRRKKQAA
jgi:hypothetical protein